MMRVDAHICVCVCLIRKGAVEGRLAQKGPWKWGCGQRGEGDVGREWMVEMGVSFTVRAMGL